MHLSFFNKTYRLNLFIFFSFLEHLPSKHVFSVFSIPILVQDIHFGHVHFKISQSRIISKKNTFI